MGSINHVKTLKNRSHLLHDYACEAFQREHFDLAIFYGEQALKLRLKSLILRLLGYVPRIHSVGELLGLLLKALKGLGREELARRLGELTEAYRGELRSIDEAYTASHYPPRMYERDDVAKALRVVGKVFKELEDVEGNVSPT